MTQQKHRISQTAGTWERQAEEVLARAARPGAAEILALIRQLNPTGRDLEPAVSRRRYQLKSRLQSLLLRYYLSDIEITLEREPNGILLLRHRYVERNQSTHAVLEELAEDVRSRVQHQLDSQIAEHVMMPSLPEFQVEVPQGHTSASAHRRKGKVQTVSVDQDSAVDLDLPVAELIRCGRAAILAYEYETARAQLEAAVRVSGGALAAVLPLLELLVESLALYSEALGLVPLLSSESEAEPAVRALLGLAAACSAETSEAEYWLRGLDDAQAAPVWLALTERAIQDGSAVSASERLKRARELGAAVADLVPLEARLNTLCQKTWKDAEQQLELLLRAGDLERAEPQARALLVHWPTSQVAQRVVASSAARRRSLSCERLQREAEEALVAQDFAAAAKQVRAAKALGADTGTLEQRLAAAIELAQERGDAEQVERIVAQLQAGPPAAVLHQYLALAGRLRSRVRALVDTPLLLWLDQLEVPAMGAHAQAAIEAVLALLHAESQSDPHAVLAMLSPHEKVLERVVHYRVVVNKARTAATAQRQRLVEENLAAAEAALEAGDDAEAAAQLARIEPRHIGAAGRERTAVARARLERRSELADRREELSALLQDGNLLRAQEQARALLSLCDAEELFCAVARCDEIAERIRAEWRLRVYSFDGVPLSELPYVGAVVSHGAIQLPIRQSLVGDELTIAMTCGDRLFLWVLSVSQRQLRHAVVLRTPHPLGHVEVVATTEGLWLVGEEHLLLLAPTTYDVRLFRDVREFLKPGQRLEQLYLLPQAGYLWIGCEGDEHNSMLVVDIRPFRKLNAAEKYRIAFNFAKITHADSEV